MELRYKPDAERVLDRYESWWDCDNDTPLVEMRASLPFERASRSYESAKDWWYDFEYRLESHEAECEHTVFLADTLPAFNPNMGPDLLATLWGTEMQFAWDTTWVSPIASSCAEVLELVPSFETHLWKSAVRLTELSLAAGEGKWLTCFHDLHPNADVPSALIGPETLCMDFADDLPTVKRAIEAVTPTCIEAYERLLALTGTPSMSWLHAPSRGRMHIPQCDFSAMISTDMFVEAVLPSIREELAVTDRGIYHLDGPTALRHLDVLLQEPRIHGIQWVYGAGNGPALKWVDVYRRIQSAGKCMQIVAETPEDIVELAKALEPQGVLFCAAFGLPLAGAQALIESLGTPL